MEITKGMSQGGTENAIAHEVSHAHDSLNMAQFIKDQSAVFATHNPEKAVPRKR